MDCINPGDLTLALEYDLFDIYGDDLWNLMFLANYHLLIGLEQP